MPRQKADFPIPLESYDYGDVTLDIYPDAQLPKLRGMHGHYKKIQTLSLILEAILDLREGAKRGFKKQTFARIRYSAVELAAYFDQLHPRRHAKTVLIRISRLALSIYALTGDDCVRKQYLTEAGPNGNVGSAKNL